MITTTKPKVLTRKEFLDNMVAFYGEDPVNRRSKHTDQYFGETCAYHGENGSRCAIGRWIPDSKYNPSIEGQNLMSIPVQDCIPKEVLDLGVDFLQRCQYLHDGDPYWNDNGLSDLGATELESIKKAYC